MIFPIRKLVALILRIGKVQIIVARVSYHCFIEIQIRLGKTSINVFDYIYHYHSRNTYESRNFHRRN